MAIPNPDVLYFQYFGGAGASQISIEREIEEIDWRYIVYNDIYLWSIANRRTFWSIGDYNNPIQIQEATPSTTKVAEGYWSLSEGRLDILWLYDLENVTCTIKLYTLGAVLIATQTQAQVARGQGTKTFAAVASTATEGYFTVEVTPSSASPTVASVYGLKLIEQRIALADL